MLPKPSHVDLEAGGEETHIYTYRQRDDKSMISPSLDPPSPRLPERAERAERVQRAQKALKLQRFGA